MYIDTETLMSVVLPATEQCPHITSCFIASTFDAIKPKCLFSAYLETHNVRHYPHILPFN